MYAGVKRILKDVLENKAENEHQEQTEDNFNLAPQKGAPLKRAYKKIKMIIKSKFCGYIDHL